MLFLRSSISFLALLVAISTEVTSFAVLPDIRANVGNSRSASPLNVFSSPDPSDHGDPGRHKREFMNLEPLEETELRRQRIEQDNENKEKFVPFGDELWDLRTQLNNLSARLMSAITEGEPDVEEMTRERLREIEKLDPELVYMIELAELDQAAGEGRHEDAKKHQSKALAARSCLPQFNLEGLWIGKYGAHGYEMVNITYVGDTLIATKVTGDKNVPRGEITFQIDLHPMPRNSSPMGQQHEQLAPIKLTNKAARKWGTRELPRYSGLGRVAEEGFRNAQWMDGQLIIIGDEYFSFAWVPAELQIFFGRPSPELALKMLRDGGISEFRSGAKPFDAPPSLDDNVNTLKDFATRCLEVTGEVEDDRGEYNFESCIWSSDPDSDVCYFE